MRGLRPAGAPRCFAATASRREGNPLSSARRRRNPVRTGEDAGPASAVCFPQSPSKGQSGKRVLRACDIFCGAGGSSAGAREAGVEMVGAIDMCPIATSTYQANFPGAHVVTDRLENVDVGAFKRQVGNVDVLLASPECRNHTCAKGARPRDEASRDTAMQVVEHARELAPRWLVLENVIYMRPWSRYPELKRSLEELGYRLHEHTLDSSDFGVAQKRRRLFLVGDKVNANPKDLPTLG